MSLDPEVSQAVANAARAVSITKSLIEKARTAEERFELERQLTLHEEEMQRVQLLVRGTWGS